MSDKIKILINEATKKFRPELITIITSAGRIIRLICVTHQVNAKIYDSIYVKPLHRNTCEFAYFRDMLYNISKYFNSFLCVAI